MKRKEPVEERLAPQPTMEYAASQIKSALEATKSSPDLSKRANQNVHKVKVKLRDIVLHCSSFSITLFAVIALHYVSF